MVTPTDGFSEFRGKIDYRTSKRSPVWWVISHIKRYWHLFTITIIVQLIASYFQASIPRVIGQIAQNLITPNFSVSNFDSLVLQIVSLGVGAGLLLLVRSFTIEIVSQKMEQNTRDELYASLLGKSLTFHDKQQIGDLMSRVATDVRQLNFLVNPGFLLVFAAVVNLIIPFVLMYQINPLLAIVPLLYVIVFLVELRLYINKLTPVSFMMRKEMASMSSTLNESISGIQLVRGSAEEKSEKKKFLQDVERYTKYAIESGKIQARYRPLLWIGIFTAIGFFVGLIMVGNNMITPGQLIEFVLLFQLFRFPTFINIFALLFFTVGNASAKRILELINETTDIDDNPSGHKGLIKDSIVFDDVSFGYHSDKFVLKHISFTVEAGQTVALVGMTGSGKTSITKLLSRLYDPQEGTIYADDINLRDWSLESLRNQIAVVEQDIFLFSRSIKDNIVLGVPNPTEEEIINAAKLAQAHEFIMKTEDGYDTIVGERGVMLSGGQRQRIAIARAILRNPSILILDDASSAIDSKTEDEIQKAISSVLKGRISFLITHRLAQIKKADLILVIDKGEIIAQGSHTTLMQVSEKYKSLFTTLAV